MKIARRGFIGTLAAGLLAVKVRVSDRVLSRSEIRKVNKVVGAAARKYKALGQQKPQALQTWNAPVGTPFPAPGEDPQPPWERV